MKVTRRSIPHDMLSAEQAGKRLTIYTLHHRIVCRVVRGTETLAHHEFTHPQLCALFERLRDGIQDDLDT